jgi:hypothetical protein
MRFITAFTLAVILCVALVGCAKKEIDSNKISVVYNVNYAADGKTYVQASRHFGNDKSAVNFNATSKQSFSFNGVPMLPQFNSIYYAAVIDSPAQHTGTFTFTDETGTAYTTPLNYSSQHTIPAAFTGLTRNTDTTFTWNGDPLSGNEFLQLIIAIGGTAQKFSATAPQTSIPITGYLLNAFAAGNNNATAQLYFKVTQTNATGAPQGSTTIIEETGREKIISIF